MIAVIVALVVVMLWSAFSAPLDRRGITSALFLVVTGFVASLFVPAGLEQQLELSVAERVAEVALVLLLFSDATRLDLRELKHQLRWPSRLLLIGLPLTIAAGTAVGLLIFPGMALASVVLLAAMLAPTDAALGQKVISDESVPPRVRQALDVESGLNDGLAVPLFLVALSIANAEIETSVTTAVLSNMANQIGWGLLAGAVAGVFGGLLFRLADKRAWMNSHWRQVLPLTAALLAFAMADSLGGSGFIAAFVGGMVFGSIAGSKRTTLSFLAEETGEVFAAVTWIAFGALALSLAIPNLTWQIGLYSLLSLTAVRMLPVAIALAGRGIQIQTIAFIGWFGPRGLASLVFALIAMDEGIPEGETVLSTVVVTVALSVLLHGLTSVPLVALYHRWSASHIAANPTAAESKETAMPRTRHARPARNGSTSSSQ